MATVKTITTLAQYLADRKWLFFERGMMTVWNELKTISDAAIEGAGASMPSGKSTLGACLLTTNFVPDIVELGPSTGQPNVGGATGIAGPPTNSR